jgi:H+/Cl- antiporter ClcA/CBS domain-containing protein
MITTVSNTPTWMPELPQAIAPPDLAPDPQSERQPHWFHRWQPSPDSLVLIPALFIGAGTGLAMVLFQYLIELFQTLSFGQLMGQLSILGAWTLVFIPTIGGAIVGLMRWRYSHFLSHGFSALLSYLGIPKITPLQPFIKMLAAAISLGTGASLGPEGPSVEIGANIGILLGQLFKVSSQRYRLLIGAGAAAGFAAGFNAPIAGVFFALEVVLSTTFTTSAVSLLLLSAVVSSTVSHIFYGEHTAFHLPGYQVLSNWEWIFYLGLGLLASLVSIVYTKGIKFAHACFRGDVAFCKRLSKLPKPIHPILGGLCVGLIALKLPHILGIGYGMLETILEGKQFPIYFLVMLLCVKLVVVAVSLGSGLIGGVFAPAMFLGACLGGAYGIGLAHLVPASVLEIAPPQAYAMVGMAAVLAGSVRAPLTAILLLFELTQNYLIILPLMAAVGVSVWVVTLFESSPSRQGLNLQQMGVNLERQDDLEVLQQVSIATVMKYSYVKLPASMSLLRAAWAIAQNKSHTALVFDEQDELIGTIGLTEIKKKLVQVASKSAGSYELDTPLKEICTTDILCAYEDESVTEALERIQTKDLYLLPVVAKDNPRKVLGVLEKNQIAWAGDLAVTQAMLLPYIPKLYLTAATTPVTATVVATDVNSERVSSASGS